MPLNDRRSMSVVDRRRVTFFTPKKVTKEGREGLRRPARAAPGARYARRPLAGAPPRAPGLSPLRRPGPAGRILCKDGLRPNPCDPSAASGWPSAKVGGALSRINWRVFSIPPGAAPRAQCLCPRVSGAVPKVHSWRHGRFCVARSAHGEAENCAALPRTRAERANARNGRCFPPGVTASLPTAGLLGAAAPAFYPRLNGRERWGDSQGGRALRPAFFK